MVMFIVGILLFLIMMYLGYLDFKFQAHRDKLRKIKLGILPQKELEKIKNNIDFDMIGKI